MKKSWNFMIDQGGTFTDIIALNPEKKLVSLKVLSHSHNKNEFPILRGIKKLIKTSRGFENFPINSIKIGTTIATNALLERKGEKVLLCVTKGFKDNLIIGDQKRHNLFERHFLRKPAIYKNVIEIDERISKDGDIIKKIDKKLNKKKLKKIFNEGIKSISIVFINSFKHCIHEKIVGKIAKDIGFKFVSCSYQVSPTINYTARGYTTLVDAYLKPLIQNYVKKILKTIKAKEISFMQSNGFLCEKDSFNGKNAILSGPAGGVNAGIKIAKDNKIKKIIGFDMGGTSSDIWHFNNGIEKNLETKISDILIKTPSLKIDSIASGGGSVIKYEHQRFVVGPESAGSFPGPSCYRNNGPLTLTDCNLVLGKISAKNFPKYFGKNKNSAILKSVSIKKFKSLLKYIRKDFPKYENLYEVADSFVKVAIENMANAIKKISLQKGYDIRNHTLLVFGSASGQYCCQVADKLNIKKILFHPLSSLFSAFGVGISHYGHIQQMTIEKKFSSSNLRYSMKLIKGELNKNDYKEYRFILRLKYQGSNTVIQSRISNVSIKHISNLFHIEHKRQFGFNFLDRTIMIDSIEIESIKKVRKNIDTKNIYYLQKKRKKFIQNTLIFYQNKWVKVQNINLSSFKVNKKIKGPVLLNDFNTSIFIEDDWKIKLLKSGVLEIKRNKAKSKYNKKIKNQTSSSNPELLEIFNNLFFSTAEQMGEVLKNTAQSINIKERLDYSCALFDIQGNLIANAPHIPIHLGAMSETVKYCIRNYYNYFIEGKSLIHNDPYTGGTHLPDLTVLTPYLDKKNKKVLFYLANRAHHSDIGGISPGSMPAFSKNISEEGIVFKGFPIDPNGQIMEKQILKKLNETEYPSRDPHLNLSDIKAQIASTRKGIIEIERIINDYGIKTVFNYVHFIQNNCANIIKNVIKKIPHTKFKVSMDNGAFINLRMYFENKLIIDFKGSSPQLLNNFNTPTAVTKSVIIYFLRTLIKENIPLNEGCLEEVEIKIPQNSMLNPKAPAPVVAGNVETSQTLIDLLNGAIRVQAACYGSMSNITFGDKNFGYYETICGGEGASLNSNGTDAVHCHMTNTSITDAEILEWNYPVILKSFSIRKNSGGKGKNKGGNGTIREICFLSSLDLTILSNRRKVKPFGIEGGKSGKVGKNTIIRKNGIAEELKPSCFIKVFKGDVLKIETPGGGGYGKQ